MSRLSADRLAVSCPGRSVLTDVSLSIEAGTVTALIGPNGCCKSTLLKQLARLMKVAGGAALLDGKASHKTPSREIARANAMLPRRHSAPDILTVRELIEQGRYTHAGAFRALRANDRDAVLTSAMLKAVFDVEATIVDDPVTGRPDVFPGRTPVAADAADFYSDEAPIGIAETPDITAEPDGAPRRVQRFAR